MCNEFLAAMVRQPQSTWLRRGLFQIHLWTGISIGLYVVVVTVTGSALVYKAKLNALFTPPTIVVPSGSLKSEDELRRSAEEQFPRFQVDSVEMPRRPDRPAVVTLSRGRYEQFRLLDPYTAADLGLAGNETPQILWLIELHDDLLGGETGRTVNGVGALLLVVMCLTGLVIWWPGVGTWRRGLMVKQGVSWRRLTFDLHSMIGFWTVVLIFIWAVSGAYLAFPVMFQTIADYVEPPELLGPTEVSWGEWIFAWLVRLHFGRQLGSPPFTDVIGWLWVVVGLAPTALFITGFTMWWQRVIRKKKLA